MQLPSNYVLVVPDSTIHGVIRQEIVNSLPENSMRQISNAVRNATFSTNLWESNTYGPWQLFPSKSEMALQSSIPHWSFHKTSTHQYQQHFFERIGKPSHTPQRYRIRICPFCEKNFTTKHFKRHVEKSCTVAKLKGASLEERRLAANNNCSPEEFHRKQLVKSVSANIANELKGCVKISTDGQESSATIVINNQKQILTNETDKDIHHLATSFLDGYTYSWLPGSKLKTKKSQSTALRTILNFSKCRTLSDMNFKFWDNFFKSNHIVQRVRSSKQSNTTTVARRMQYQRCKALLDFVRWLTSNEHMSESPILISLLSTLSSCLLRSCKLDSGLKKTKRCKYEHSIALPHLYCTFLDNFIANNVNHRNLYGLKLARICIAINGLTGCR